MTSLTIPLEKDELKELLNKGWMTHDAMWFYNCLEEFGIEKANKMNLAAIKSMATIEIKRYQKALGMEKLETFDEVRRFFNLAIEIATGKFMKFNYNLVANNLMHTEMESCFSHEGMKRRGIADRYECGVMLRIDTWLETLGIKYTVTPKVTGCMMHTDGRCFRDYRFFFEK